MMPFEAKLLTQRLSQALTYRASTCGSIFTQIFWTLLKVVIIESCYLSSSKAGEGNFKLAQAVSYICVGQALFRFIPLGGDARFQEQIRTGDISYYLARPLDIYRYCYFQCCAKLIVDGITRCIPLLLIAGILGATNLSYGITGVNWEGATLALFIMAIFCAVFLSASIEAFLSMTSFLTISGEGINALMLPLALITTGVILPVPLYPEWLQYLCYWSPFQLILDFPARILVGGLGVEFILYGFIRSIIWIVVFFLLGRTLLKKGLTRFDVLGG